MFTSNNLCLKIFDTIQAKSDAPTSKKTLDDDEDDESSLDWWSRYYETVKDEEREEDEKKQKETKSKPEIIKKKKNLEDGDMEGEKRVKKPNPKITRLKVHKLRFIYFFNPRLHSLTIHETVLIDCEHILLVVLLLIYWHSQIFKENLELIELQGTKFSCF